MRNYKLLSCIFVFIFASWSCGQSKEDLELMAAIDEIPEPSPMLYLGEKELVTSEVASKVGRISNSKYYLYGGSRTREFTFQIGNDTLKNELAYDLTLASVGTSNVKVEMILKRDKKETVLGQDLFKVSSSKYQPYSGTITCPSTAAANSGDQFILRLTVSGSDFGINHALDSSVRIFKPTSALAATVAEQRKKALMWMARNNKFGLKSELFTNFRSQLDDVILAGKNIKWEMGWGLSKSGKPYSLKWVDNAFSSKEMSMKEAEEGKLKEMSLSRTIL